MTVTAERPVRRQSQAQQNGAKLERILIDREGSADLYRTVVAGPSGQRGDRLIARVRYTYQDPYELEIVNVTPGSPSCGDVAGYARRTDGSGPTAAGWVIWDDRESDGIWWMGYASTLALGCDVLLNGAHAAAGRHDSERISGGKWTPNPNT